MAKKYLLGLDLGTNSIGWCVTDENNKIVRKGSKRLWGIRLFDEAETAATRRINRESRRRTLRRAQRIDWLQSFFIEEIRKADPHFIERLNQSFLHIEDRESELKNHKYLFNDNDFTDKDYYSKYPTIYHLRKELLSSDKKTDIRLLYLAIAHIIKYRGNFLYEGREFTPGDKNELEELLIQLNNEISKLDDISQINVTDDLLNALDNEMKQIKGLTRTKEKLLDLFNTNDKYYKNVIVPLIAGSEVATKKIFDYDDDIDPSKISTKSATFDESISKLSELFDGTPEYNIILIAKKISDILILNKLLGSEKYLSNAMCNKYDQHKQDLKLLKYYIRQNLPERFDEVFRIYDKDLNNYVRYVGSTNTDLAKVRCEHCSRDDFYKYLKKLLKLDGVKKIEDIKDDYLRNIYEKMNDGDYLPRQNSTDNGVLPYQLNLMELELMLDKQSKYYDFLNVVDEDGVSTKDKIISLLTFRIPYYVGPLLANNGSARSKNSWIERTSNEPLRPWNFDNYVDKHKTAEKFIKRMLNRCTYLNDCYCLPAKSIMYQRYDLYNFINKIRINGGLLSSKDKEGLIKNVFLKYKTVKKKNILEYFKSVYGVEVNVTTSTGKELEEVRSSLSSEIIFKEILGDSYSESLSDAIIQDLTIFEDKKIVEERLKDIHGIKNQKTINKIKGLNLKGWGRLSRELLELKTDSYVNVDTGEVVEKSIIQILKETNLNFIEIINKKEYCFQELIADHNGVFVGGNESKEQIVSFINESYASPGMKRAIVQAVAIIEDIKKIIGQPIDEYYIECTRSNKQEKKRTKSRKDKILEYYATAKALVNEAIKEGLKNPESIDLNSFKSEKIWLYFLQLGKCAYTLEPIKFEDLFDDQKYDVDHIIPQSKIKDDSIDNKVLVRKDANNAKSDRYPLTGLTCINSNARSFWSMLKNNGLMSDKKYSNLTRTEDLTDDELELFVNRQIVFTNQAIKALVGVIERFEKNKDGKNPLIVYSKAENVTDFRNQYSIIKSREANNFHHAHDAYLNICIGRLLATYYNYGARPDFIKYLREKNMSIVPSKIWSDNKDHPRKPIYDKDNGLVWDYQNSVQIIKDNIFKTFDILSTTRSYIKPGLFAKVSIHKASDDKDGNLVPLKAGSKNNSIKSALSQTNKYGGYSDLVYGFYALANYHYEKGDVVILEAIPNAYANPSDELSIKRYLENKENVRVDIILPCVRVKTLLRKGKSKIIVTGNSGGTLLVSNQSEPIFSYKEIDIIKKITKMLTKAQEERIKFYDIKKVDGKNVIVDLPEMDQKLSNLFPINNDGSIIISPSGSNKKAHDRLLSLEDSEYLFDILMNKMSLDIYNEISGIKSFINGCDKEEVANLFTNMSIYRRVYLLNELLTMINTSRELSDLSLIGFGKNSGLNRINKSLVQHFDIVTQSPTGYFEKVIWHGDK